MECYHERKNGMKVFISWSGERSLKIAKSLKKWIKNVIQTSEPFVSSEDIQKGTRWSVDLAKELQDSNFGILCVTRDNCEAPWLLFEAGALSKSMGKAHVVPFLFDLNPSDLSDSPLMQFQAVPFSKEEINKLIISLHNQTESKLDNLDEIFEKWYPDLERSLDEITSGDFGEDENADEEMVVKSHQVLEEILSLSRDNQKLLRSSENRTTEGLEGVTKKLERISSQNERNDEYSRRRRKMHPMMLEEILHFSRKEMNGNYGFLVALSFFREDFPWVYDLGKDLFDILKSNKSRKQKDEAFHNFKHMLENTYHFARMTRDPKDDYIFHPELPMMLLDLLERTMLRELSDVVTDK